MAYVWLALAGLLLILITAAAEERMETIAARLAVSMGVMMMADWVAYGFFELYKYTPGLLANPKADSALGVILAEVFFVPGLTIFLDRFIPGLWGSLLGALLLTGLEYALLPTGLYSHAGWTLGYTLVGFAVYFGLLHLYWNAERRGDLREQWASRVVRLALAVEAVALLTLWLLTTDYVRINIGAVLPTPEANHALGRFLMYVPVMVPAGYWVMDGGVTSRWWRIGAATGFLLILRGWLAVAHLQTFRPPWSWWMDALTQAAVILAAALIHDWIGDSRPEALRS